METRHTLTHVRQHKPTCAACVVGAKLDHCDCGAIDSAGLPIPILTDHAPELLEAAICLRQHLALFCGPDDAIASSIFEIADAAISKAKGTS